MQDGLVASIPTELPLTVIQYFRSNPTGNVVLSEQHVVQASHGGKRITLLDRATRRFVASYTPSGKLKQKRS